MWWKTFCMPDFVFTSFLKDNYPLSGELWKRARELIDRVAEATVLQDLDVFKKDLIRTAVTELNIQAPQLGRTRPAAEREGNTRWNADHSIGSPTRRYYIAVEVKGDITLTKHWPDLTGPNLDAVDAVAVEEIGGLDATMKASAEAVRRYVDAGHVWAIGADDDPREGRPATFSLYTYFDLTLEEEAAVARGDLDMSQLVSERRTFIAPILTAIDKQIQNFLSRELPEKLLEFAEAKRKQLANRQAVRENLSFPEDWQGREPELEDSQPVEPLAAEPAPMPVPERLEEVHLNPRSRLSTATFQDVMFTVRHWANAVERYPAAFGVLAEDRISDLLAATLNATLPGAGREVYSRGGKSDIFIHADVLDPGRGPATVFICEAKWATAHDVIRSAVNPQLFGYLNVHDTAAILLVLMKQKDFARARATYLEVLTSINGYENTQDEPVAGWPLLRFVIDGHAVTVCAAFTHLPLTGLRDED